VHSIWMHVHPIWILVILMVMLPIDLNGHIAGSPAATAGNCTLTFSWQKSAFSSWDVYDGIGRVIVNWWQLHHAQGSAAAS